MDQYHSTVNKMVQSEYKRLGAMDIPAKPTAALPGYSGFIPLFFLSVAYASVSGVVTSTSTA